MPNMSEGKEPLRQEEVKKVQSSPPPTFKSGAETAASSGALKKEASVPGKALTTGKEPNLGFLLEESNLYEYAIGVRDVSISAKTYKGTGVYISKPVHIEGNVLEVEMEAVEEHPLFDNVSGMASTRRTSVEYYISGAERPTLGEWIPILPLGQDAVRSERLFVRNGTATLRFKADIASVVLYRDGKRMGSEEYVVTESGASVFIEGSKANSIYTADYKPAKGTDPSRIDMSRVEGSIRRQVDLFREGTNHNKTVKLSRYPYIDWAKIHSGEAYAPFEVRLKNASIIGPKGISYTEVGTEDEGVPFTKDRTSYMDGRWTKLERYGPKDGEYKGFDYYNHKDKLVFSETFNRANILNEMDDERASHGRAEIEVGYEYLSTTFRLKIILRRNADDVEMVSPSVQRYQLRFKTMK